MFILHGFGLVTLFIGIAFYFLPAIIGRNKRNAGAILLLNLLRRLVIEIIQTRLTDADDLRVPGQFRQRLRRDHGQHIRRMVGVNAHTGPDRLKTLGDGDGLPALRVGDADGHHFPDTRRHGAPDDLLLLAGGGKIIEMAM